MVLAYPVPAPSSQALKEGLLRAVALYPHLLGRFAHGRRFLHLNNQGVLVIEAHLSADLADLLATGMGTDVAGFYPAVPQVTFIIISNPACRGSFQLFHC
jgi:hypothetical protein